MRKFSVFLVFPLLWSCAFGAMAQESVDSSRVLRVMSFNIYHGETMNGDFNLEEIACVIRGAEPDLVALQEVDLYTGRSGGRDLAAELGVLTRMVPLFGRAMPFDGGEYGEGILSRYSFLCTRNHALPAGEGKEPRAALEVRIVLESGDTIIFLGTHLDHTGERDRIYQADRIRQILGDMDLPVLLAGDLNATPESRTMEILFADLKASDTEFSPTFPSDGPRIKIDYMLYGPPERWKVLESRVICDSVASDHCALLSVLELLPAR
jgi:endonuclease/exonuclease/phosphatase family metal-dependent hydrolase